MHRTKASFSRLQFFFQIGRRHRTKASFCGVCVGISMGLCNSLFADRSGVTASRFLLVAGACVLLLCFAAEDCRSHCNGGVKVANAALAAEFLDFNTFHFHFKIPSKKEIKIVVFPVLDLRFAIFNWWNLKEATRFAFTSSTFGI